MNGLWLLILLGRWSMVTGWIELFTHKPVAKREFVSVDALGGPYDLKMNTDPRSYEMLSRDKDDLVTGDMFTVVREGPVYPPLRSYLAQTTPDDDNDDIHEQAIGGGMNSPPDPPLSSNGSGRRTPDYFGGAARYQAPTRSFSSPRPPTRDGQSWEQAGAAQPYSPPVAHHYHQQSPPVGAHPYNQHSPPAGAQHYSQNSYSNTPPESMNPLQMNRI